MQDKYKFTCWLIIAVGWNIFERILNKNQSISIWRIFYFSLCEKYDKMADKVNETPKTTQELVEIQEYLKTVSKTLSSHCFKKV